MMSGLTSPAVKCPARRDHFVAIAAVSPPVQPGELEGGLIGI
jgi:hypothetical protein